MPFFKRPSSASDGSKLNIDNMYFDYNDRSNIIVHANAAAEGDALPQISSTVQEFTSVESSPVTVVCSGTVQAVGDRWGVLVSDTQEGQLGAVCIKTKRVLLRATASQTPAPGDAAYIVEATGLVTTTSNSGANPQIGVYLPVEGNISTAKVTNPDGLPAGDYHLVSLGF